MLVTIHRDVMSAVRGMLRSLRRGIDYPSIWVDEDVAVILNRWNCPAFTQILVDIRDGEPIFLFRPEQTIA
jgi:hypothetical protein